MKAAVSLFAPLLGGRRLTLVRTDQLPPWTGSFLLERTHDTLLVCSDELTPEEILDDYCQLAHGRAPRPHALQEGASELLPAERPLP